MFRLTPALIPFVVTCLLLCASGGRIATVQTVADDTVNPPRIDLEMILQKLHQQQQRIDLQDKRDAQQRQWNVEQQQRSAQQDERINELEEENRLLSESANNELRQVSTTGVSYTLGAGHHSEGYGTSLSDLESKVGTLWNDIPIWQPYLEGSFRGVGITERGELDLFLPLIGSDSALLFADLRGSIGDTGNHEDNWSVA